MSTDLQIVSDFESEIDTQIDRFFEQKRVTIDQAEMQEKRFIIKELALASKKSEIIKRLNDYRTERGLPVLGDKFDLFYYQKEYAELIESISLAYAQNIMKKYRFANRITRIGKLNEIAESILDRIRAREDDALQLKLDFREEKVHNENIKIFTTLLATVDEQMGKLKITQIDVNVRSQNEKPLITNADDIKELIRKTIVDKYSEQLPNSVDANFVDLTDYHKCAFAEEWSGGHTHCQYFGDRCKVQTEEMKSCPHFVNRIYLENKDQMAKLFRDKNLSASSIAEIAGCKQVDEKVIERVRKYLRKFDLWRNTGSPDKGELPDVSAG